MTPPDEGTTRAARDPDGADAALARGGDAAAFERIYRRHAARVHSLARRLVGPGDADDGAQEVFIRVWEKLHLFRGDSAFGTWLHRLAINHLLGRGASLRTRWDREDEREDAHEMLAAPHGAGPGFSMDFENALERLAAGMREVFVLHDVEGYQHDEIARMLGIAEGTSKSQLHRARLILRRHLD
ncbi:MAG TPA: RNA polymerase sigma factor [Gemmatimonadaceae bacterium]|nr:RNA polymerase sigma factor [Gemmatimonadaceae bacterium]